MTKFSDPSGLPYLISADSLPSVSDLPKLTFVNPDSPTISNDASVAFLIVKSDLGIADPIPTRPVFNAASAVPPVPTLTAVDAVVTPELISPVILPVTFPVRLPAVSYTHLRAHET